MDIDTPLNVNDYPCVVYKLTCEKTNKVYYGSTKHSLNHRASKGWYNCSCKDFINMKKEVIYFVENEDELLEKENYYIINFNCVNKNDAIASIERQKERNRSNKNTKECSKKWRITVTNEKRFYCSLCDISFQAKSKLKRHQDGFRHKLKNESFLKYGENWKQFYLEDNKNRYNKNRRDKNKSTKDI